MSQRTDAAKATVCFPELVRSLGLGLCHQYFRYQTLALVAAGFFFSALEYCKSPHLFVFNCHNSPVFIQVLAATTPLVKFSCSRFTTKMDIILSN